MTKPSSFIPTIEDSFIPDDPKLNTNPTFNLLSSTIEAVKDIPAQIGDLLSIPAALARQPHPP